MDPITASIIALAIALTQVFKTVGGKFFPSISGGVGAMIVNALLTSLGIIVKAGNASADTLLQALMAFIVGTGVFHVGQNIIRAGSASKGGGAVASISMFLILVSVSFTACVTAVPVADSPLACVPAPAAICNGVGSVCSGTVQNGASLRHVAVSVCETP